MVKLLVFRHVAHEVLGTLDPLLKKSGFRIKYVNFGRPTYSIPDLENYDGLVVLGGPMNVDQTKQYPHLVEEIRAIEDMIGMKKPILGICLGAQLIAKALGAEVRRNGRKEIGWYDVFPTEEGKKDPLIGNFGEIEKIFQWHGDTFEIPHGAIHLAESEFCKNQAFRYGDNVYGFQFHLEVDKSMIERWLTVPYNVEELRALKGTINPDDIKRETPLYIDRLYNLSSAVFYKFIDMFEGIEKHLVLPSR